MGFFDDIGKGFKDVGNDFKKAGDKVGHLLSDGEHKIESGVTTIYKDARSATAYVGKHAVNDVDKLTSTLTSPIFLILVGGVVLVVLLK